MKEKSSKASGAVKEGLVDRHKISVKDSMPASEKTQRMPKGSDRA